MASKWARPLLAGNPFPEPDDRPDGRRQRHIPELGDDLRESQQDLGGYGQFATQIRVQVLEHGNDKEEHRGHDQHDEAHHRGRVHHRRSNLGAQLHLRFDRVRQTDQCLVEEATDLTGPHHRYIQLTECLRKLGHGFGKAGSLFYLRLDLEDGLGQRSILCLLDQNVQ